MHIGLFRDESVGFCLAPYVINRNEVYRMQYLDSFNFSSVFSWSNWLDGWLRALPLERGSKFQPLKSKPQAGKRLCPALPPRFFWGGCSDGKPCPVLSEEEPPPLSGANRGRGAAVEPLPPPPGAVPPPGAAGACSAGGTGGCCRPLGTCRLSTLWHAGGERKREKNIPYTHPTPPPVFHLLLFPISGRNLWAYSFWILEIRGRRNCKGTLIESQPSCSSWGRRTAVILPENVWGGPDPKFNVSWALVM